MLLSEAVEALCIATRADGRSLRTVEAYRQRLTPLVAFLGDPPAESVTTGDLRRFVVHLQEQPTRWADHPRHAERAGGLSPFTIASSVRHVKRLFSFLDAEGVITGNPARRIKTPSPRRVEPKGIAQGDFLALLGTTEGGTVADLRDRAVLLLLADTGCRVGGLCGLRVQDVDLGTRLARVTEKGGKTRFVPFTRTTAEAIGRWSEVRPQDRGDSLFVGLGNRARDELTPTGVAKMLKARAKRAGVAGPVNPHAFRHGFAKSYLMGGGDLGTLADLLGHTSVMVTKDYYGIFTMQELQEKHARHSPIAQLFEGVRDDN